MIWLECGDINANPTPITTLGRPGGLSPLIRYDSEPDMNPIMNGSLPPADPNPDPPDPDSLSTELKKTHLTTPVLSNGHVGPGGPEGPGGTPSTCNGDRLSSPDTNPGSSQQKDEAEVTQAGPVTLPPPPDDPSDGVRYVVYQSEREMPDIMRLIQKDLSEPYSIYTYRYFIHNWPHLCFMVRQKTIAEILCMMS